VYKGYEQAEQLLQLQLQYRFL